MPKHCLGDAGHLAVAILGYSDGKQDADVATRKRFSQMLSRKADYSAYATTSKLLGGLLESEGPSAARLFLDNEHTNRSPDRIAEHCDDCFGEPYPRSKKWARWYARVLKSGWRWRTRRDRNRMTETDQRTVDVTRN